MPNSQRIPSRVLAKLGILLCALFIAFSASRLNAQNSAQIVLRGTVTSADHEPIRNATVSVLPTTPVTAVLTTARTDLEGRWSISIESSSPTFIVSVTALGYAPKRLSASRSGDGKPVVVDIALMPSSGVLATVRVVDKQRRPPQRDPNGIAREQTASERATDQISGATAAGDKGNLAAIAATAPGVSLVPGTNGGPAGFSVLGLGADQNSVMLNGMQFGGGDIPRDAVALTRVSTSAFDASRGGFSGGQLVIAALAGNNFHDRGAHVTFDSPTLQVTDAVGRRLGSPYANTQFSGNMSGPIVLEKLFYSASVQGGRRSADFQSLLSGDAFTLDRVGVAADSLRRLTATLNTQGIPVTSGDVPDAQQRDNLSSLARIDWRRSPKVNATFLGSFRHNRSSALPLAPATFPGHGGRDRSTGADLSGTLSSILRKNLLSDFRVGGSWNASTSAPYLRLPDARVLVNSTLSDGTTGLTALQFGGNALLPRESQRVNVELSEQLSWLSSNAKHRFRATTNLYHDHLSEQQSPNALGSYFFASVADVEANRPTSFVRSLGSSATDAGVLNGALSFGDNWRPTDHLQLLLGGRVESTNFTAAPAYNPAVETALHVRNDYAPSEVHVSPRLGVAWGIGNRGTKGLGGAPLFFLRGGVGEFRNNALANIMTPALKATGLAGTVQRVQCIGAAVPRPDWSAFSENALNIPTQCAEGNSSFAESLPNVHFIAPGFAAQRSRRANLSVQGPFFTKWLVLQVEGIYSQNLHQQSVTDVNFNTSTRFSLIDEANRPVYVQPASVVQASGALTVRDSRRAAQFGSVTQLNTDLQSSSRQLVFSFSPLTFVPGFTWNMSYVVQHVSEHTRGFDGTTSGDPQRIEVSRASLDARHQLNGSVTIRAGGLFSLAIWGRVSSGLPFTPVVGTDINGDGFANDRAFVFTRASADTTAAQGVASLLANSTGRVRRCLTSQLGHVAERNSCEGPWSATSNAVITFNPERIGLQNRVTLMLSMANLPAGVDAMLHGGSRLHGWGQSAMPDPSLLTVRGFDAAANRFRYAVNPRFGSTSAQRSALRAPFVTTLEARIQLGHVESEQAVRQVMSPGRTRGNDKLTAFQLKSLLMNTVTDPIRLLISVKDSLTIITRPQMLRMTALQRRMSVQQDSIWDPVIAYLQGQPKNYDERAVMERVHQAQLRMFDGIVVAMREVKTILAPEQIRELPPFILPAFDEKTLMLARPSLSFFPLY